MNRAVTPKRNSSQLVRSPGKSPVKKHPLSEGKIQEMLRENRQKLSHTLDTYTMLIRSSNPIRCLEHNSAISVFCETEGRLLCTNCLFSSHVHKFHKVGPVDRSQDKLGESVQRLQPIVDKEIEVLVTVKQVVLSHLQQEEAEFQKGLATLALSYAQAHQLLEDNFNTAKNALLDNIHQLRTRYQTVALELGLLKDVYDVRPCLLNIDIGKVELQQVTIYHHQLLHTLASQKKFEGNVWSAPRNEMRALCSQQEQKIFAINSQLASQLSS